MPSVSFSPRVVLLSGGVLSVEDSGGSHQRRRGGVPARERRIATITNSQKVHINECKGERGGWLEVRPLASRPPSITPSYHLFSATDYVADCGSSGCYCYPIGKCKRCSKFEIVSPARSGL